MGGVITRQTLASADDIKRRNLKLSNCYRVFQMLAIEHDVPVVACTLYVYESGSGYTTEVDLHLRAPLNRDWFRMSGRATGSGYHKASAALEDAYVYSESMILQGKLGAAGDTAIKEALRTHVESLGYTGVITENVINV